MLPNLIVIGAAKCGTTTLHHHLGLHPEIAMSATKELRFFVAERNWERGVEWYERQFPEGTAVRGEASPIYTGYPHFAGVPERMAGVVPDARLIYLVRDPIDRIESNYRQYLRHRKNPRLPELRAAPEDSYLVARSRYHLQLEQYLEHFPAERILVLDADDLAADPHGTMARVFAWVGVDDGFSSRKFRLRRNETGRRDRRRRLPAEVRDGLTEFLRDDVARLRAHTGLAFAGWSL